MSEALFYIILILVCVTFSQKSVTLAAYIAMLINGGYISSSINFYLSIFVSVFFSNVSILPMIMLAPEYFYGVNWIGALFVLFCFFVVSFIGNWIMSLRNSIILDSRRFHKSVSAMKIIFGMIVFYTAIMLLEIGFSVSNYATIFIFVLSLVAFFRFKINPTIIIFFALVITYFLY